MSLLDELAAEVCAASDHLPVSVLKTAVVDARCAHERLVAAVLLGGTVQATLHRLAAATAHLENGTGLIMRAQDEVGAYLVAIGGHGPHGVPHRLATDAPASERAGAVPPGLPRHRVAAWIEHARMSPATRPKTDDVPPGLPEHRVIARIERARVRTAADARPADVTAGLTARIGRQLGRGAHA
jgi:hypothetical protein